MEPQQELGEAEAAACLNVPVFLLRDFISYEFNGKKLDAISRRPLRFNKYDLEQFKAHLSSPWPEDRRDPPLPIKRYLDVEAQSVGGCAACRRSFAGYQYAHIDPWAKSKNHSPQNLLRLCANCHGEIGSDVKKLLAIKSVVRQIFFAWHIVTVEKSRARYRVAFGASAALSLGLSAAALFGYSGISEENRKLQESWIAAENVKKVQKLLEDKPNGESLTIVGSPAGRHQVIHNVSRFAPQLSAINARAPISRREALGLSRSLVSLAPEWPYGYLYVGMLTEDRTEQAVALGKVRAALEADATDPDLHLAAALICANAGDFEAAAAHLRLLTEGRRTPAGPLFAVFPKETPPSLQSGLRAYIGK